MTIFYLYLIFPDQFFYSDDFIKITAICFGHCQMVEEF